MLDIEVELYVVSKILLRKVLEMVLQDLILEPLNTVYIGQRHESCNSARHRAFSFAGSIQAPDRNCNNTLHREYKMLSVYDIKKKEMKK